MRNAPEIQRYRTYRCVFRPRSTSPSGGEIKPELVPYIGRSSILEAWWVIDMDEMYPDEWAMGNVDDGWPVTWIASGDLEIVEEIQ